MLYTENFDNLSIGNLGTDPNDVIPGQGGWFTKVDRELATLPNIPPTNADNTSFSIVNESGRGRVLMISSPNTPPSTTSSILETTSTKTTNLEPLIDKQNTNNQVFKLEIDYYIGDKHITNQSGNKIFIYKKNSEPIVYFNFRTINGVLSAYHNKGNGTMEYARLNGYNQSIVPFNTWIKFIVYLDYANKKIYYEIPYFGTVVKNDFLNLSTSTNLLEDFKPSDLQLVSSRIINSGVMVDQALFKYANIKITAIQNVPLSLSEFLNEKFTVFPNPASNTLNISNTVNLMIDELNIYDIAGKLVKTEKKAPTENIVLSIETLKQGTCMLHINTKEGTAVKKK